MQGVDGAAQLVKMSQLMFLRITSAIVGSLKYRNGTVMIQLILVARFVVDLPAVFINVHYYVIQAHALLVQQWLPKLAVVVKSQKLKNVVQGLFYNVTQYVAEYSTAGFIHVRKNVIMVVASYATRL